MLGLARTANISQWVFDLDGTLSNPRAGMLESLNYALQQQGAACLSETEIDRYIGPPLEETLGELVGTCEPAVIDQLVADYRQHYHEAGYCNNVLYHGIGDVLEALRQQSFTLGVCTAKTAVIAKKILSHFDILEQFAFINGGDVGVTKGSQLRALLEEKRIDGAALMIGDRSYDLVAANDNALRSCAVTWGFGGNAELQREGPDFTVTTPNELLRLAGLRSPLQGGSDQVVRSE